MSQVPLNPQGSENRLTSRWQAVLPKLGLGVFVLCAVIARAEPVLGIGLFLFSTPVFARAAWVCRRRTVNGTTLTWLGCVNVLLASAGIVALVVLSSGIAFVTVCFPAGFVVLDMSHSSANGAAFVWFAIIPGALSGIGIAALVIQKMWWRGVDIRREDDPEQHETETRVK